VIVAPAAMSHAAILWPIGHVAVDRQCMAVDRDCLAARSGRSATATLSCGASFMTRHQNLP
jgi:hypothetical protein